MKNSFGTPEGFNCSHVSTRDAEATTVVTICRDTLDNGKVVLATSNTLPNVTWSTIIGAMASFGMLVATPLAVAL